MSSENDDRSRRKALKVLGMGALIGGANVPARATVEPQEIAAINTIQALRSAVSTAGIVYLLGHTVPGKGAGLFHWNADATNADDNGITIRPIAVQQSEPGRWIRILANADAVDPRWFGCAVDGTTDDTVAFQAALEAAALLKMKTRIPQGRLKISQHVHLYGNPCLEGDSPQSSELVFYNNASLRFYDAAVGEFGSNQQIELRHLGFRCADVRNTSFVIDLRFTGGGGTTAQSVVIEDIEITGLQANSGFTGGIYLFNARNLKIRGCRIVGNQSIVEWSGIFGIRIDGDEQPVEFCLTDCACYFVDKAFYLNGRGAGGGIEGIYMSQCTAVSCNYGVYADSDNVNPLIRITGSHFNCFNANILSLNFTHLVISNNVFYAAGPRLGHDHVCILLMSDQASGGHVAIISSNILLGANFTGVQKNGIVVSGVAVFNVLITDNCVGGYTTPIWLGQGTHDIVVTGTNRIFGNTNNCVVDEGTGNTVQIQKCGVP